MEVSPLRVLKAFSMRAMDLDDQDFMVAGIPSPKSVASINSFVEGLSLPPLAEVYSPEKFHVTIRYWEGCEDKIPMVTSWLDTNRELFSPCYCTPSSLEILGDDGCLVLRLFSRTLEGIFSKLDSSLDSMGLPEHSYPSYKAHVTLAEGLESVLSESPKLPKSIVLSSFVFQDGSEETHWSSV